MSRLLYILFFFLQFACLPAQGPIGSWTDHLPYRSVNLVTAGTNEVYASTDYAISIYNRQYNELRKLSKVNGLNDCGISTIDYSEEKEVLIIAYTSGNIDLYDNGRTTNIPDILNTVIPGDKSINRIRSYGNYAYLASNLGIILLDIVKREIKDTYKPSAEGDKNPVFDVSIMGDTIFAATEDGLYKAPVNNQGLSYFNNWTPVDNTQGISFTCLASTTSGLYANKKNDGMVNDSVLFYSQGELITVEVIAPSANYTFESSGDKLIIASGSTVNIVESTGSLVKTIGEYGETEIDARNALIIGEDIYIADRNQGLVQLAGGSTDNNNYTNYVPAGPYVNNNYNISTSGGEVWVAGGRVNAAWNNTFTTFSFSGFMDRQWWSVLRYDAWDVMRVLPVPGESGHIYVSTWGTGVYEYNDRQLVNHWDESTLGSIIPGKDFVRICGMALDSEKRLWIAQSEMPENIKVKMKDGSWVSLPYFIDVPTIGDMIITRANHKWVVLPRGNGLFVLDDNNTPENFSDDRHKKLTVKDQDGNILSDIYSIAEDLDGHVWIGTSNGPAVFYNPERVFEDNYFASRIKIPRNDGTGLADYLLGTETVLSIAIDGGNRKWFGTNSSGAFLVDETNDKLVKSYNESNSPLLSDQVVSVATDETTGEVWFATGKGIVVVRETGTKGSGEMNKVYAYPNPVRENYNGDVTITGLARNTDVKITDISGNLVYETTSTGGDATWDLRTYNGRMVSTGVYLILCSTEDGSVSASAKLLIIR